MAENKEKWPTERVMPETISEVASIVAEQQAELDAARKHGYGILEVSKHRFQIIRFVGGSYLFTKAVAPLYEAIGKPMDHEKVSEELARLVAEWEAK